MWKDSLRLGVAAAIMMVFAVAADTAVAQTVGLPGKQLRMVVGMPPGGGVDAYARLVQRHLVRHLPTPLPIVVQNVPGAGSLRSVMTLANSWQEPDISIATFSSSLLTEAITHPDRIKVDFRDFAFLGNIAEDSRVCFVTAQAGVSGLDALKSRGPLTFGATAPGTSGNLDTAILQKLLGERNLLVLGWVLRIIALGPNHGPRNLRDGERCSRHNFGLD